MSFDEVALAMPPNCFSVVASRSLNMKTNSYDFSGLEGAKYVDSLNRLDLQGANRHTVDVQRNLRDRDARA